MSQALLDPPFRAEHIGSLGRPEPLLDARDAVAAGKLDAAELRALEDRYAREAIALQERLGFKAITDGELRRYTYTDNFTTTGLTGIRAEWRAAGAWTYQNASGHTTLGRVPEVYDRITRVSANPANFIFMKDNATTAMPKMTLPGPCYIHFRAGRENISRDVYPNLADFWSDLVAAYHAELQALYDAGCRYVQLDETSLAKLGDPKMREALTARGDEWQALLDQYTEVINQVVAGAPEGMRVGIHLCRGNNQGHWQAAGGYDVIAQHLFRKLAIGFFLLEYDSPRAGTFEPLRVVPEDKVVILGLLSTKTAELESEELLVDRINEASRYMPLERLGLSPQCGFSGGGKVSVCNPEQQEAKLRRTIETARKVWADA